MNRRILAVGLLAAALPGFIATASAQTQPPRIAHAVDMSVLHAAGKSVKEIQQSLNRDKYKAWERFGVQPQIHIARVYETMKGAN